MCESSWVKLLMRIRPVRSRSYHPAVHRGAFAKTRVGLTFILSDLVLVVRELQIHSAAMQINLLAEERANYCRALNVPPRSPLADCRVPHPGVDVQVRLERLPQRKV